MFRSFWFPIICLALLMAVSPIMAQGGLSDNELELVTRAETAFTNLANADAYTLSGTCNDQLDADIVMKIGTQTSRMGPPLQAHDYSLSRLYSQSDDGLILYTVLVDEGGDEEQVITINAETLLMNDDAYLKADVSLDADVTTIDWILFEDTEEWPFDSLTLQTSFFDLPDNEWRLYDLLDEFEVIFDAPSSVTTEISELDDGTEVEIITLALPIDNMSSIASLSSPDDWKLDRISGDDAYVMFTIDIDGNLLGLSYGYDYWVKILTDNTGNNSLEFKSTLVCDFSFEQEVDLSTLPNIE